MKPLQQYKLIKALRPFSLVVAVISCALGIWIAWQQGFTDGSLAFWIIAGGVLAQAGINLINDVEDLPELIRTASGSFAVEKLIRRNSLAGILCFFLAILIAGYLTTLRGWPLLALIAVSAVFALSYNLGPINFKHRGLAIVQVFLLMGIVMVQGAYYAMSGLFSVEVLLLSIPVSLLVSLLLLSNELRDWEVDKQNGAATLTVRIGYENAVRLYWAMLAIAYGLALFFTRGEQLNQMLWLLLPLPLLFPIARYLKADERVQLTPLTGRFLFLFGIGYMLSLYPLV